MLKHTYPNQITAGNQIIKAFEYGFDHVILIAQMQSGKTGTARHVASDFIQKKKSDIYFICGMNDNDLQQQSINEFAGVLDESRILFSQRLQQINKQHSSLLSVPDLVILDESHYGSCKYSQTDQFLKKRKGCKLLSISATPMAEIASTPNSYKVYLLPDSDYYSIKELFQAHRIFQSADIVNEPKKFIEIISQEYERQADEAVKYIIVRSPNRWVCNDLQRSLLKLEFNIDFLNFHSCMMKLTDINEIVKNPPLKTTIIWIYGSLRAGKQLNTEFIGAVHDTPHSAPDVIAQSLLGRILGYGKKSHNVHCYTDVQSAYLMYYWINHGFDRELIPAGCRRVRNGLRPNAKKWNNHPPIAVKLTEDYRTQFSDLKMLYGNRYPYKEEMFDAIIDCCTDVVDKEQLYTIREDYQPGRCGGLMILTEFNADRTFKDNWIRLFNAYLTKTPVRGFDAIQTEEHQKFYYMFVNLNINDEQYGWALITYKEHLGENDIGVANYVTASETSMFSS